MSRLTESEIDNLFKNAKKAQKMAYSPYSNFKVGAAILCKDNSIFTGCNIENASYGGTICGERVAILKAVSEGKRQFKFLVIVTSSDDIIPSCGICLQTISEFCENDFPIYIYNNDGTEVLKTTFPKDLNYLVNNKKYLQDL